MTILEQRVQDQWKSLKNNGWNHQCRPTVEYRIEIAVHQDADKRRKNCVTNEDKITTSTFEVEKQNQRQNGGNAAALCPHGP